MSDCQSPAPANSVPPDPEEGEDILPWARAVTTFLRRFAPRPSADIIPLSSTGGTRYTFARRSRTGGGEGATAATWPFQGYRSAYTGGGSPPSDQALRFRAKLGTVKNRVPSNMAQEFTADDDAETFVWVETTHDDDGALTSCLIDTGTEIPTEPDPTPETAPAHSYCGLFRVTAAAGAITLFEPLRQAALDVNVIVTDFPDCETKTYSYQWT